MSFDNHPHKRSHTVHQPYDDTVIAIPQLPHSVSALSTTVLSTNQSTQRESTQRRAWHRATILGSWIALVWRSTSHRPRMRFGLVTIFVLALLMWLLWVRSNGDENKNSLPVAQTIDFIQPLQYIDLDDSLFARSTIGTDFRTFHASSSAKLVRLPTSLRLDDADRRLTFPTWPAEWYAKAQLYSFKKDEVDYTWFPFNEGRPPYEYELDQSEEEICREAAPTSTAKSSTSIRRQQYDSDFPRMSSRTPYSILRDKVCDGRFGGIFMESPATRVPTATNQPTVGTTRASTHPPSSLSIANLKSVPSSALISSMNLPPPVLSIVTPIYNSPSFSISTSIIHGSFQQWEWIIINDGSTRLDTLKMMEPFRNHPDPRIRLIDLPKNVGLPAARNRGFELSRGRFVIFADADDMFEPTYLEKCTLFLYFHPEHDVCSAWSFNFNIAGQEFAYDNIGFDKNSDNLDTNHCMSMSVIRREAFIDVGGYDETLRSGLEDWDLWLHLLAHSRWGHTLPEYLFWYRASARDRWGAISDPKQFDEFVAGRKKKYAEMYHRRDVLKEEVVPVNRLAKDRSDMQLLVTEPPLFNRLKSSQPSRTHQESVVKRKPRALLLTHFSRIGGAEKFNVNVLEQMSRRGWEMSAVFFMNEVLESSIMPRARMVTNDIFTLPVFLQPAHFAPFLVYLLHSRRPDVVLLSNTEEAFVLLDYVRAFSDHFAPELVIVDYTHAEEDDWKNGGYPRFGVEQRHLLDRSVVCAESTRRWMIAQGHHPDRTAVVYIGTEITERKKSSLQHYSQRIRNMTIAPNLYSNSNVSLRTLQQTRDTMDQSISLRDPLLRNAVRRRLGLDDDTVLVLYIARLEAGKLPSVFTETVIQVYQTFLNRTRNASRFKNKFHFAIIGDGPLRREVVNRLSKSPAQSHFTYCGMVKDADAMHEYMSAGDVVFLPSRKEGISLALMEGMSYEQVPVSVALGGQSEVIITGESGYLIPLDERDGHNAMIHAFTIILIDLISNKARREQMALAAVQRIQRFRTEDMVMGLQREFCVAFRQRELLYINRRRRSRINAERIQSTNLPQDDSPSPFSRNSLFHLCPLLTPIDQTEIDHEGTSSSPSISVVASDDEFTLHSPRSLLSPNYAHLLEQSRIKSEYLRLQVVAEETWTALQASGGSNGGSKSQLFPSVPMQPLSIHFVNGISILAAGLSSHVSGGGRSNYRMLPINLLMMTSAEIEYNYIAFLHFRRIVNASSVDRSTDLGVSTPTSRSNFTLDSKVGLFGDHTPMKDNAMHPTNEWAIGEILLDRHVIRIPDAVKPGFYLIYCGFFRNDSPTWERLDFMRGKKQGKIVSFRERHFQLGIVEIE